MYRAYFWGERKDKKCDRERHKNAYNSSWQHDPFDGELRKHEKRSRFFVQFDNGDTSRKSLLSTEVRISET